MTDNPNSVTSAISDNNGLSVIPSDKHLESELLTQLQRVAIATEHCFNKALADNATMHSQSMYLHLASKLTRSYAALASALSRSRGGVTEQKIIVQHLNINGGGYNKNGD